MQSQLGHVSPASDTIHPFAFQVAGACVNTVLCITTLYITDFFLCCSALVSYIDRQIDIDMYSFFDCFHAFKWYISYSEHLGPEENHELSL